MKRIKDYTDILLYIHSQGEVEIKVVAEKFNMGASTIDSLFKQWMRNDYIKREKKKGTYGGYGYHYSLTENGTNFLKERALKIINTLGLNKDDLEMD